MNIRSGHSREEWGFAVTYQCHHCGSEDVLRNVKTGITATAGRIGLSFRVGILGGTEPFIADLCRQCGTIVRLYVRMPNRRWITEK